MNLHKFRLSFSTIMDPNFGGEIKKLSKKEGQSGRGRMKSNCIASNLIGGTKTFMFSSIIYDILNLHLPLFDYFLSQLLHLSMVKHCNFVCYYQVQRMKISTMVKFYYRGFN